MKNHWKLLLSAILLVSIFALTACGDKDSNDTPDPTAPNGTSGEQSGGGEDTAPERDLGGITINIANWWNDYDTATEEPESAPERARLQDRQLQEQTYNFRMYEVAFGSWHDVRDNLSTELMSGNREMQFWMVEPAWFVTNNNQGLFAPIDMRYFEDDLGINWNRGIIELTMRDGIPYGFAHGAEIAGGVYFNMRLLEESGVERDYPFTLQEQNNWTWDTFIEMARRLSRDIDGDGITDIWAITAFHKDMLAYALASNDAAFTRIDPATGRFVNTTGEDAFREVIDFMVQLREEGLAMHESDVGGEWNAFIQEFNEGRGAIRVANNHVAGGEINPIIEDDFGYVVFPRGPRRTTYMNWITRNFNVIPFYYSAEDVDNFMFAMQRWIRPLPTDSDDDWMLEERNNHRDPRSYQETMALYTRNFEMQTTPAHAMMPGLGDTLDTLFAYKLWNNQHDPAEIIESSQQVWDAFIERCNNLGIE